MVYSREPADAATSCKSKGSNLRIHYKHAREVAMAIRGLGLKRAQRYLKDVLARKDIIPFRKHTGNQGRHAQAKRHKVTQGGWPQKTVRHVLDLLQNAESNAEIQGLDVERLSIFHVQANRAPKLRRRTYRAHGRINPFMSSPAHLELILSTKGDQVQKGDEAEKAPSKKQQKKLKSGASAGTVATTEQ